MKVKIFVTALGYIIGELKAEYQEFTVICNPGLIQTTRNGNSISFVIGEMIPPFLKNKKELMQKLSINRDHVLYSDEATEDMVASYQEYVKRLEAKESKIKVVGADFLTRIKR